MNDAIIEGTKGNYASMVLSNPEIVLPDWRHSRSRMEKEGDLGLCPDITLIKRYATDINTLKDAYREGGPSHEWLLKSGYQIVRFVDGLIAHSSCGG
jgi:hypothetical protein